MTPGILSGLPGDWLYGIPLSSVRGAAHDLNFLQGLQLQRSWHYQQLPGKLTPKLSIWCQDSSSFCSSEKAALSFAPQKERGKGPGSPQYVQLYLALAQFSPGGK